MNNFRTLILIFGLGVLLKLNLVACKCEQMKRESYVLLGLKYSDIIFLGELIDSASTDYSYSFKILEIFKGNYKNKIIKGHIFNSCSLHPYDQGLWLVYASFKNDSTIDIGRCGPSVSLINPDRLIYPFSIRFENESEVEQLQRNTEYLKKRIDGLSSWYYDLYKLREYKQSNQIEKPKRKLDYQLIALVFSLILNIFMFTMIIRRKK